MQAILLVGFLCLVCALVCGVQGVMYIRRLIIYPSSRPEMSVSALMLTVLLVAAFVLGKAAWIRLIP